MTREELYKIPDIVLKTLQCESEGCAGLYYKECTDSIIEVCCYLGIDYCIDQILKYINEKFDGDSNDLITNFVYYQSEAKVREYNHNYIQLVKQEL